MQWASKRATGAGVTLLALLVATAFVAVWLPREAAGQREVRAIGPLVVLSPVTGKIAGTAPVFAPAGASVSAILTDGHGGWWIAGSFTQAGGFRCPNLMHLLSDLQVDRNWCPHVKGPAEVLTKSGSTLFVSGSTVRPADLAPYLTAIDERTSDVLPWNAQADGYVSTLAAQGSTLYVTGTFGSIGGKVRLGLGAVDTRTGKATAWNPRPDIGTHGDPPVCTIAPAGRVVFVDGLFSHIGGADRKRGFATLDAKTGKATPFSPSADSPIVGNGRLYVNFYFGRFAAFDLPSLVRDRRWKPPRNTHWQIIAADSRFVYVDTSYFYTSDAGRLEQVVIALDARTGVIRWRSPVLAAKGRGTSLVFGSSPAYVLVGHRTVFTC